MWIHAISSLNIVYEIAATDSELPKHMRQSAALAKYAYEIADAMLEERRK